MSLKNYCQDELFSHTTPHYIAISDFTSGICKINEDSPSVSISFLKIKC